MKKILILFSLLLLSCNSTEPIDDSILLAGDYFPLEIGNTWEYTYKTSGSIAKIERIVKNNITHEDGSNLWGYTEAVKVINPDPNEPIVGYYTLKNDGLYFYSSHKDTMFQGTNILCRKVLLLKSPFVIGTEWVTKEGTHCKVAFTGNYNVLDSEYPNTVLVVSQNDHSIDSSWYSDNIGIIKRVYNSGLTTQYPSTVSWELRKYSF